MDRVGVGIDLVTVAVIVLEGDVDHDIDIEIRVRRGGFPVEADWLGVENVFILIEEGDILGDTVVKLEGVGLVNPFVYKSNLDARVKEGEFPKTLSKELELKFPRGEKDLRVG
jgi:hypothetical protein